MIHLKAGKPGIRVPLGFLLAAVPKCFKGDSYRQFRAERDRGREASREATLERDRLFAAEILKSPEADDEQKQWPGRSWEPPKPCRPAAAVVRMCVK